MRARCIATLRPSPAQLRWPSHLLTCRASASCIPPAGCFHVERVTIRIFHLEHCPTFGQQPQYKAPRRPLADTSRHHPFALQPVLPARPPTLAPALKPATFHSAPIRHFHLTITLPNMLSRGFRRHNYIVKRHHRPAVTLRDAR